MKIKQAFAIPETDHSYSTLFVVSEDGDVYGVKLVIGWDNNKPAWFKIDPPTEQKRRKFMADNTGSIKLRELVASCKSDPTISTTYVLKQLYAAFPQLQTNT
jgi:hypothetical protein